MYNIGDKVETPLGVGVVIFLGNYTVFVNINGKELQFDKAVVKPYTSAHDKLIALGYEKIQRERYVRYIGETTITIYDDKTYSCSDTNLELSRILTQYLEELK